MSLDEAEMVCTRKDKRTGGLPDEWSRRQTGKPPGQPALWGRCEVLASPEPCLGRYPRGFLRWAVEAAGVASDRVLHVCSGGMDRAAALGGWRVDVRAAAAPDVRADGRRLPFRDGAFAAVFIDPPYSIEYARELYGVEYARPSHLLAEATRVVQPGGAIGFLHFLVANPPKGTRIESITGITQGTGYRIRAWVVYRKDALGLFESEARAADAAGDGGA